MLTHPSALLSQCSLTKKWKETEAGEAERERRKRDRGQRQGLQGRKIRSPRASKVKEEEKKRQGEKRMQGDTETDRKGEGQGGEELRRSAAEERGTWKVTRTVERWSLLFSCDKSRRKGNIVLPRLRSLLMGLKNWLRLPRKRELLP